MRTLFILAAILSTQVCKAGDWLCTEESSIRDGAGIHACGVGIDKDESKARSNALDAAMSEFNQLCESSSDCVGHQRIAKPGRMTCSFDKDVFKCYKLVTYQIKAELIKNPSILIAERDTSLVCNDTCNSKVHDCDWPGDLWKWDRGCHDAVHRPFKGNQW